MPPLNKGIMKAMNASMDISSAETISQVIRAASWQPSRVLRAFREPNSPLRRNWNAIVFMSIVFNWISVPLVLAFGKLFITPNAEKLLYVFNLLFDGCYVLDILVGFKAGLILDGSIVTSSKKVGEHYVKTWFFLDVLSVFPVDYLVFFFASMQIQYLLRLPRLIKIFKSSLFWENWEMNTSNPSSIRLLKLMLFIMILSIASYEDFPNNNKWFMFNATKMSESTLHDAYIKSFFWAFTSMSGLGGESSLPRTYVELLFTIFVAVVGVGVLAAVIGNAWNLLSEDPVNEEYRKNMDNMNVFMSKNNLPMQLRNRVRQHYECLVSRHGVAEDMIFSSLPEHLRLDVSLFINRELFEKVPFFQGCEQGFIKRIAVHLQPRFFSPGEWILHAGDYGSDMYFISRGKVQAVDLQGEFLSKMKRTASVQALKYTELFVLSKEDFDSVLLDYPEYNSRIEKIAAERLEQVHHELQLIHRNRGILKQRDKNLMDIAAKFRKGELAVQSADKDLLPLGLSKQSIQQMSKRELIELNAKVCSVSQIIAESLQNCKIN
ncbi:putative transcriptional regulator, Crp/Fnr family [Planoprotostelium fungivorum]|uniref:Putative transcriptional regulator, Crp/Fnr family n=1 Tax=Planoprotostelium fungivorum TaxID=1890364 RepID=A0A2P6MX71_9EUKA|nr:putative transcriptional regulator, Crp/Fnr family [Planoprotostelium fungivorum]PRP76310.1 putative transcriptional regulator, Crp/Fnr family [Planoprotostelium fungivorum]